MNLRCLLRGHNYFKINTVWQPDKHDEYLATNYGGYVRYDEYDVYKCSRCLKKKALTTGKMKFEYC